MRTDANQIQNIKYLSLIKIVVNKIIRYYNIADFWIILAQRMEKIVCIDSRTWNELIIRLTECSEIYHLT